MTTGENQECVSVAVTGLGLEKEKFLGDKTVPDGKGISIGVAVKMVLDEWGIKTWAERRNWRTVKRSQ